MSFLNLEVDDPESREKIQTLVRQWLTDAIPRLSLPDKLKLEIERKSNYLAVNWEGKVEAVLGGMPDPDLLRARVYENHAIVDLRFSNIRINYE
jgi:hypothetical protein